MTTRDFISAVARHYECQYGEILASGRKEHIANARAVVQYFMRQRGWTYQRIADYFGAKSHASVMSNCRKVAASVEMMEIIEKIDVTRY